MACPAEHCHALLAADMLYLLLTCFTCTTQVMRRVLSFYKNPNAKKAAKRLRQEEVDAKQTTLSHFFSRSAAASKK
jgi:hypothetical protein